MSTQKSNKESDKNYDAMHKEDLRIQECMLNPIAFSARNNMDNLYPHQAMNAPDAREFQRAIIKEFNDHTEKNYC